MEESEEVGTTVELYIYDLTNGMAAMMSQILIGEIINVITSYRNYIDLKLNFSLFSVTWKF